MKPLRVVASLAGMILVTSCGTPALGTQGEALGPSLTPIDAWQSYANTEVGFTIRFPSSWQMEPMPDENAGQLHGVSFKGSEGGVELQWGTGIGAACPEGYQPLKVAQGELSACHSQAADGTERWSLQAKQLGQVSFTGNAYTSDTSGASRDLVLQMLSTLSFP